MVQVPYKPVADVPRDISTPRVSIQTDIAAFGGTVAQATEHLGKTVEGAGDELFKRALALQQLKNESEAKEADTDYMITAGKLHADYSSLQGKAAVDAYPKYIEDLRQARTARRDDMSNDMARKMYDSQSLSTMGRTIFNGAGHAATENKKWAMGTAKAQIDLDANEVSDSPKDDVLFQQKLERTRNNVAQLSTLQGFEEGSPQARDLEKDQTSKLWLQRITGLSRKAPFDAKSMLEKSAKNMTEADYLKADQIVTSTGRAVGAANIAQEIDPTKPLAEQEADAREKAKKFSPDDPLLEQHAVSAVRGNYNQSKYAKNQEDYTNQQAIDAAIGQGVKNEQELRANPDVAKAIDSLPANKRNAIPGAINRFNAARDKVANEDSFMKLWGMSNNDVEGFLNIDPTSQQLNQSQMKAIMDRQQKLKSIPAQDPRVNRAITVMRGSMGAQIEALGIFRRTEQNKDDYDHFTGAMSSAIDVWTEQHKTAPTAKDINETIGPQVIQQRIEKKYFGLWDTKRPFYDQDVPDKFADQVKADVIAKGGVEPSKEQLYRAWIQSQTIKLYGKKDGQ